MNDGLLTFPPRPLRLKPLQGTGGAARTGIRAIEDIALAELRVACRDNNVVDVARMFGVRRLSASAKARIEAA